METETETEMEQQDAAAEAIMRGAYVGLEPREVWRHFSHLNAIPRPSAREAAARAYVERVADAAGARTRTDGAGNIVVYKEGVGERAVAIQSHLDMVCEKRPGREIDWEREGVLPRRENDRIFADGTTLGADNGMGAAMALALVSTANLEHPPLEILFTVEEETGLQGAANLDGSLLSAQWLLNLDTEEPDEIVIGCAGGRGVDLRLPLERAPHGSHDGHFGEAFEISVSGLEGGHSGIQIAEPLGNAIQILARALKYLEENGLDFRVVEMHGGNAHNAIPRDASAILSVAAADAARLEQLVASRAREVRAQWAAHEPSLQISAQPLQESHSLLTEDSTRALIDLLCDAPHGVLAWSQKWAGKVETSCNLATLETNGGAASIHLSGRSFREPAMDAWQSEAQALGARFGASSTIRDGYPGWEPSESATQSGVSLLEIGARAFERVTGSRPKIEIVHAGLECGIILSKRPNMEAISFGPLIRGAHTPEEWVGIASVEQSWKILIEMLRDLASTPST